MFGADGNRVGIRVRMEFEIEDFIDLESISMS